VLGAVRRHPVIAAILIACTVGGAVCGALFFDYAGPLLYRTIAGAVAGLGLGLFVTATKMIG
jgi:hypothetical protein